MNLPKKNRFYSTETGTLVQSENRTKFIEVTETQVLVCAHTPFLEP